MRWEPMGGGSSVSDKAFCSSHHLPSRALQRMPWCHSALQILRHLFFRHCEYVCRTLTVNSAAKALVPSCPLNGFGGGFHTGCLLQRPHLQLSCTHFDKPPRRSQCNLMCVVDMCKYSGLCISGLRLARLRKTTGLVCGVVTCSVKLTHWHLVLPESSKLYSSKLSQNCETAL